MELMSSLLLCALATLVPQALGKKSIMSTGLNKTVILKRTPSMDKDHVISEQVPSSMNKVSDLKSVFLDATCKRCHNCMERAIKSHKVQNQIDLLKNEQFHSELVDQEINKRNKRKTNNKKSKREQSKKNEKTTVIAPVFRKRQIDDSQAPEQIMPSIEEIY
nr:uncharacterized protein LOC113398728 [Vanessa tameamea]